MSLLLESSRFAGLSANYAKSPVHSRGASVAWLRRCFAEQRPEHVLDLAAGAGHATLATVPSGTRLTAVDLAPDMLAEYGRRAVSLGFQGVQLVHASAEALPLPDASVDAVVCRLGIHHVSDLDLCFAEISRVLRPGGTFYLVEHYVGDSPADRLLLDALFRQHDPSHAHTLDVDVYAERAAAAGLRLRDFRRGEPEVDRLLSVDLWFELAATPLANRGPVKFKLACLSQNLRQRLGFKVEKGVIFFDVPVNLSRFEKV